MLLVSTDETRSRSLAQALKAQALIVKTLASARAVLDWFDGDEVGNSARFVLFDLSSIDHPQSSALTIRQVRNVSARPLLIFVSDRLPTDDARGIQDDELCLPASLPVERLAAWLTWLAAVQALTYNPTQAVDWGRLVPSHPQGFMTRWFLGCEGGPAIVAVLTWLEELLIATDGSFSNSRMKNCLIQYLHRLVDAFARELTSDDLTDSR